jgi:hypothetical protein
MEEILKLGKITLQTLNRVMEEFTIIIHHEYALDIAKGEKVHINNPYRIVIKQKSTISFYGNTLLRGFSGPSFIMPSKRIIQYNDILFINATIEFNYLQKTFSLDREKGLLIIDHTNK